MCTDHFLFHFIALNLPSLSYFVLKKDRSSPFMIDLPRLKAIGTGLAFGYAIVKDCDKRFQAHCRRRPAQVTFNSIASTPL